jgi:hypothetical protein
MMSSAGPSEAKNPKTGMTHAEMKEFIRNHFDLESPHPARG